MFSKKLLILYICLLLISIIIMVSLIYIRSIGGPARDFYEIHNEGILRVVTESDQTGYVLSGDQVEGFHYELSREIARLSGLEVFIYVDMSLTNSFKGLRANQYDIIARNIPTTSELKERYAFTEPIVLSKQVLVQRIRAYNNGIYPLRNHLELAKKIIHVPKGSPAIMRLKNLEDEIGESIYISEESLSSEQLIGKVANGDIDYAVCDLQTALALQDQHPEIDTKTDISFTQLQSWAIRKDSPALLDSLNRWLIILRETGQFDRIYKHYYQEN